MRNFTFFIIICIIFGVAVFTGIKRNISSDLTNNELVQPKIPDIGQIQILNGCGISGAAGAVADFLRKKRFDVKNIGNAETWNYPFTIVVSRKKDLSIAQNICEALDTDKLIMLRNNDETYDVTVFIGSDFGERIK